MKKRTLSLALAAAMAVSLAGCGSSSSGTADKPAETKSAEGAQDTGAEEAASDWKWERNVEIICPWGTGGGADTTLRTFASALEKELGVSVVVNNKAGAGGVTGVQFATSQPADGYTYLLCTQSPMLAQISGATDFDVYGKIKPLCQLVHDCNIFVTSSKSPYSNYNELKEYAQANPGKGLTVQELTEVTEAMPMMAQHTMVVVTDLDIFRLDEQQRTALMALLADFPEYCTLVLVYDLLPYKRDGKMKKLCAALDKSVCEVEFRQQERAQLLRWVKRRFAAAGHDIDDATADHLLFTCGSLMTELVPEIGKIAAYAKGRAVTVEDINAVADPVLDARVFDMTNSITAGKYDQAAQVLGELLRMQTEPIVILAAVGKELRRLYTARMALDAGKDRFWLKQLWSMSSDYPAKLLMQAAGKVDHEWCQTAVIRCQRLDRRMKSEKNMDSEAELKLFLMELAGSR